jgi:hypothetical protein
MPTRTPTPTPIIDADPGPLDGRLDDILDVPQQTTILEEIAQAVVDYPSTDVELVITSTSKDGDAVNTDEEVSMTVKVTNRGPLTMKDVLLKAVAKNGARVKSGGAGAQFGPDAIQANNIELIAGHGGFDDTSARFVVEAPSDDSNDVLVDLVDITVHSWNALWDHTLNSHSRPSDTPTLTFAAVVEPA